MEFCVLLSFYFSSFDLDFVWGLFFFFGQTIYRNKIILHLKLSELLFNGSGLFQRFYSLSGVCNCRSPTIPDA